MEYKEAVAEGDQRWNELVAEWQQLDEQEDKATTAIQWRRGDILLEIEPPGLSGVNTGSYARLRHFGEEVHRELRTLTEYRETAAAWPPRARAQGASFSAHRELRSHPNRFEIVKPGMTARAAILARGGQPWRDTPASQLSDEHRQQRASDALRDLPPQQRAAVVREELEDEEVTEQVVSDPKTRANLARTEHRIDRQQQDTARERYELAEPRSHQIGAIADAEYALTKARQAFEDAAEAADTLTAHDWPDNSKERVTILTQRALAAGELVRAKVEGRNLDEELAALLEGGDA